MLGNVEKILAPAHDLGWVTRELGACSFDPFLDACEIIVSEVDPGDMDEHIRPERHFYRDTDVNHIVGIDDPGQFIAEELSVNPLERRNVSRSGARFTPDDGQVERIRSIYEIDCEIQRTWSPAGNGGREQ